jgi:hypothetical protein
MLHPPRRRGDDGMELTWGSTNVNDGTKFALRAGASWGQRQQEQRTVASPFGTMRQGAKRIVAPRTVNLLLRVYGTSADDLRANIATLAAEHRKASNTLTIKPTGASTSRTITLLDQIAYGMPLLDPRYESRKVADLDIPLVAAADILGSEVTLLSASAQTAPLVLSLGTLTGDYPAPLDLTITANTTDIHSCFVGVLKAASALEIGDLRKEAPVAGASWSGAADEDISDAKYTGGHAIGIQSATESTAVLFDSTAIRALDAGSYVPLPRVAAISASYAATIRLFSRIGSTDTTIQTAITTINTVPEYRDLDPIHIPFAATLSATPTVALGAGVAAADATDGHEAVLDNVTLLPSSWSWVGVHPSAAATDYTTIRFTADGKVYLDEREDYSAVISAGPLVAEPGAVKILIVAETVAAAATAAIKVTASFTPRYHSV